MYLLVPVLIVIGMASCIGMFTRSALNIFESAQQVPVPGEAVVTLDRAGPHIAGVYQDAGSATAALGSVEVAIAHADTGAPLTLTLASHQTTSSLQGSFTSTSWQFNVPAPGRYRVTARADKPPTGGTPMMLTVVPLDVAEMVRSFGSGFIAFIVFFGLALIAWAIIFMRRRSSLLA
jgi:hypothetical protein